MLIFIMSYLYTISIASINVNGLRDNTKRETILDYFIRKEIHIILLQETHSEQYDKSVWRKQWPGEIHFSHGSRLSRGVALLISSKSGLSTSKTEKDVG